MTPWLELKHGVIITNTIDTNVYIIIVIQLSLSAGRLNANWGFKKKKAKININCILHVSFFDNKDCIQELDCLLFNEKVNVLGALQHDITASYTHFRHIKQSDFCCTL